jgi:hypothetical protein
MFAADSRFVREVPCGCAAHVNESAVIRVICANETRQRWFPIDPIPTEERFRPSRQMWALQSPAKPYANDAEVMLV